MIELHCEQGTEAWHDARVGIPTASQFDRIVTPGGKESSQGDGYLAELLAAYFVGEADTEAEIVTEWIERGRQLEPHARSAYSLVTGLTPRTVGLCYRDSNRMVACSPDWLIDPDGGGEVKCPMAGTHLRWLARGIMPREHHCQVQASMWITGRSWWDFVSYYPGLPLFMVRCEPDERYHAALESLVPSFIAELLDARKRLIAMGVPDQYAETRRLGAGE